MIGYTTVGLMAPVGTTGNNTHAGVASIGGFAVGFDFNVEAVGATPTVTFKFQGSFDPVEVADASSSWFDIMVDPANSDTGLATDTKTAAGRYIYFARPHRFARKFRLVTSANTNITYSCRQLEKIS